MGVIPSTVGFADGRLAGVLRLRELSTWKLTVYGRNLRWKLAGDQKFDFGSRIQRRNEDRHGDRQCPISGRRVGKDQTQEKDLGVREKESQMQRESEWQLVVGIEAN